MYLYFVFALRERKNEIHKKKKYRNSRALVAQLLFASAVCSAANDIQLDIA
jgi:hypothetical protein